MSRGTMASLAGYLIIAALLLGLYSVGVLQISSTLSISGSPSNISLFNDTTIQMSPTGTFRMGTTFTISKTSIVEGAFSSTHGGEVLIVPEAGMVNFTRYHAFSTGNVSSASFYITIPPSTYQLIIINPGSYPSNITVTQPIEVIPLPTRS